MRFTDILRLSMSALFQHKLRTVLTLLGVTFGTFVLIGSLSIGSGVQETILREASKHAELRRIEVLGAVPPRTKAKAAVTGTMSEEKRQRLQKALAQNEPADEGETWVNLTPERLADLARLEHVIAVTPLIERQGHVSLNGKLAEAQTLGLRANDKHIRKRLIAGEFFRPGQPRDVLVSELLLYRLGIVDDDAVPAVLGRKLSVEYRLPDHRPHILLNLFNPGGTKMDAQDQRLLQKVIAQLPAAVEALPLAPDEKARARALLTPPKKSRSANDEIIVEEFTIAGVFRLTTADDENPRREWWLQYADLVMPLATAQEIYFRTPLLRQQGVHRGDVEVDDLEHVKAVNGRIKDIGFHTAAVIEFIEREQLMYLMIFAGMTLVAVVALVVAAIGITNTMLISVLERMREIGIMKAVGARDRHIQFIFLVEGAFIGLVGGLVGLGLSWVVSAPGDAWVRSLVQKQMNIDLKESLFAFPWWLVLGAPVFAIAVTTLAAFYPARRAAKVNPVVALRHE